MSNTSRYTSILASNNVPDDGKTVLCSAHYRFIVYRENGQPSGKVLFRFGTRANGKGQVVLPFDEVGPVITAMFDADKSIGLYA